MVNDVVGHNDAGVLQSKRNATRYQILVEIAERQPAVSQQEIADSIGITAQAVSDYLQGLLEEEFVNKHGRGRYEITKEGVDWLITHTDALRQYVSHVSENVIEQVDIEAAIATVPIEEGETVTLTMRDGFLHADSATTGSATAVAVTPAEAGDAVGVTNFDGVVEYELGAVTIGTIPSVENAQSASVATAALEQLIADHKLLATAGTEAFAIARAADKSVDIKFGTVSGVQEAATRGQSVALVATPDRLSRHTDRLREENISYEVIDLQE
ncbi:DUF7839 domain-containing protein [Halocatena halophila]|uniref:DUF7839 domain-containing protein n=1 Tax=Halocatena halophila TaxID=2814576 RepID=UPI002ED28404